MKYSNTSRSLSVLFHGLIAALMGSMGLYFGFFVVPQYFSKIKMSFTKYLFTAPYLLYLELAVIGLALFLISIYGLVQAILSITKNSDEPLRKSFTTFIAEGWVVAIFFLLQGTLLFDLIKNDSLAFVVIMSIIIAVIVLIGTNIPMVKLYDGKNSTPLLSTLSLAFATVFGCLAFLTLLSLIGGYSYDGGKFQSSVWILTELWVLFIVAAVAFGLLLATGLIVKKKGLTRVSNILAGGLSSLAGVAIGTGLLAAGSLEIVWKDNPCHLVATSVDTYAFTGYGFGIMCLVIGALLTIGSFCFFGALLSPKNNKSGSNVKA